MRVTTQQTYVSMTQSFNNLSGSLAHVVEQMATGKEILQPSDDPIAATRITQLNRQQSAIEQYQSNIDSASAGLSQQESILDGVNNSLLVVRDDLLEAANGTNTADSLASLGEDIEVAHRFNGGGAQLSGRRRALRVWRHHQRSAADCRGRR